MPIEIVEYDAILAPPDLCLKHPQLHHYTSMSGMEGIIASQSLWATHFQRLNDRTEIIHLKAEIVSALQAPVEQILQRRRSLSPRVRRQIRDAGTIAACARSIASTFVASIYDVAFTGSRAFAVPYVTSFCSHSRDQDYERHNGLLSQWRGYSMGGCSIVFDTQKLIHALQREWNAYYWVSLSIDSVVYATPGIVIADQYAFLLNELTKTIDKGIGQSETRAPLEDRGIGPLLHSVPRFKHQGFQEEREVRIVATPGAAETALQVREIRPDFSTGNVNEPLRNGLNRGRPYVELFRTLRSKLPIKQIIVGPSRRQNDNYRRALVAAAELFPVRRSETPFLE